MSILGLCQNGDVLSVFRIINIVITIIKIAVPIILIVVGMLTFAKAINIGEEDLLANAKKQIINNVIAAVLIFLVPTFVNTIINIVGTENGYKDCLKSATDEGIAKAYITTADTLLAKAEKSKKYDDYYAAVSSLSRIKDKTIKENYRKRLNVLYKDIKAARDAKNAEISSSLSASGSSSSGNSSCKASTCNKTEPDPSAALNCWPSYIKTSNFIFPKDSSTGKPLGAWPSNYKSIKTQLTGYKTYQNGKLIIPTTPANGKYNYVYEHNGIDIMASFGTPVYSPVDGVIVYSEWGHTVNKSGNETSYTVTIKSDNYFTIAGKKVNKFFMTHMSGIVYRCSSGCNKKIKKGQLIGFTGNAAGSTCGSASWAPHLHITVYPDNNYSGGLTTAQTEKLFNLKTNMNIKAGG